MAIPIVSAVTGVGAAMPAGLRPSEPAGAGSRFAELVSLHESAVGPGQGDDLVDRLGSVLTRLDHGATDLARYADRVSGVGAPRPSDLVMLSVKCTRVLFEAQLISNVASRTSEGVQQLFRQQS